MSSSGGPRMFVAGCAPPCKPSLQRTIQSHAVSADASSGPSANVGVTSPARPDRCQTHAGERLSARQTPHPASIDQGPAAADAPPFQVYGLALAHKHAPEIRHHAGLARRPLFVPAYGAFRQGIVLTVPLHVSQLAAGTTAAHVHDALQARYAGQRFVQVLPPAQAAALTHLDPASRTGCDDLQLMVFADAGGEQLLLAAVFDNLGKGAAGAAVQNLDLMLGQAAG